LKNFIDNPIKTYSSGMYLRLGFSIAINVDPDILLIDEILAVGDENFQKKCFERIEEFKEKGKTILIVSHDLNVIERMCGRVVLIDDGKQFHREEPVEAISEYHRMLFRKRKQALRLNQDEKAVPESGAIKTLAATQFNRWGSQEASITSVKFFDDRGQETYDFKTGDYLKIRMDYQAKKKIEKPVFGIALYKEDGTLLTGPNNRTGNCEIDWIEGSGSVEYTVKELPFLPGGYLFSVSIYDFSLRHAYDHLEKCLVFNVVESQKVKEKFGTLSIPSKWKHVQKGNSE